MEGFFLGMLAKGFVTLLYRYSIAIPSAVCTFVPPSRAFCSAAELHTRAVQDVAGDAVTVTTIHQAKGMEWDYVFVVGVTDGVLPDSRSKSKAQLNEERRILYVAVTRARQRVYLHHAPIWGRHARQTFAKESRFMTSEAVRAALRK